MTKFLKTLSFKPLRRRLDDDVLAGCEILTEVMQGKLWDRVEFMIKARVT
jgi:hypothetical protein